MKNLIIALAMIFVPTLASAQYSPSSDNKAIDIEFYNTWEVLPMMTTASNSDNVQDEEWYEVSDEDGTFEKGSKTSVQWIPGTEGGRDFMILVDDFDDEN